MLEYFQIGEDYDDLNEIPSQQLNIPHQLNTKLEFQNAMIMSHALNTKIWNVVRSVIDLRGYDTYLIDTDSSCFLENTNNIVVGISLFDDDDDRRDSKIIEIPVCYLWEPEEEWTAFEEAIQEKKLLAIEKERILREQQKDLIDIENLEKQLYVLERRRDELKNKI